MRDGHHGTWIGVEELLEPENRLRVEMVGRFVEEQQVRGLEKQTAQRHATTLASGETRDGSVGVRALEGVHCLRELTVEVPAVGRVDLGLQPAHLVHERVEVSVGVGHLIADLVEALDLGQDVPEGEADVLDDGLVLLKRRLLLEDAH